MQYLFRQRLLCNSSYVVPCTWCCPRSPKIACQQEPEFTLEEHDRSGGTRQPATGPSVTTEDRAKPTSQRPVEGRFLEGIDKR